MSELGIATNPSNEKQISFVGVYIEFDAVILKLDKFIYLFLTKIGKNNILSYVVILCILSTFSYFNSVFRNPIVPMLKSRLINVDLTFETFSIGKTLLHQSHLMMATMWLPKRVVDSQLK